MSRLWHLPAATPLARTSVLARFAGQNEGIRDSKSPIQMLRGPPRAPSSWQTTRSVRSRSLLSLTQVLRKVSPPRHTLMKESHRSMRACMRPWDGLTRSALGGEGPATAANWTPELRALPRTADSAFPMRCPPPRCLEAAPQATGRAQPRRCWESPCH